MTTPIVFIDTETDGLRPDRRAWEIAMIRRDDTGERTCTLLLDIDLPAADPFALKIGGYYDRHPRGRYLSGQEEKLDYVAIDPAEYAAAAVARMTHGAHLVGVNPAFDAGTLEPLLHRHGLTPGWHYHLIDVAVMALGYLHARNAPGTALPWKSDQLGEALGVEPATTEERHTALGDARWAQRMYDAMTGGARDE
jgi:DNA polymerase III epsilon subunit-like protein